MTIVGGTVRLDFVAYSPTEKDAKGQPVAVFCQRIILSPDGFLRSAEKIQESVQALSKLTQLPRAVPTQETRGELPVTAVAPAAAPSPVAAVAGAETLRGGAAVPLNVRSGRNRRTRGAGP